MKFYIKKLLTLVLVASIIVPFQNSTIFAETTSELTKTTKSVPTISLADSISYWSTFGGNSTGTGTIDSKTPTNLSTMVKKDKILPEQYFEPIIVGNYLYSITDCAYLTKYDSEGNEIARAELGASLTTWVAARMAYGDGKIFVAVNGRIKAYDAITLEPLWQSVDTKKQINGALIYHNGYVYAGVTDGSFSNPKGYFFALKTSDENSVSTNEEKDFTWKTKENKGYYWSSGVITGNAIVFADDGGTLISHHLTRDITYDTYALGDSANVRSNLLYIAESGSVIVPTQHSKQVFKIAINRDGSFQKNQIQTLQLEAELSGGIAHYNGRLYASSGGVGGSSLQVIDESTLQVIYRTSVNTQSYPLITTAYATKENNYKVYIYVIDFNGGLVKLEDSQGQTSEIKEEITEDFLSWNSNSIVGDINGNLYIYNGFNASTGNRITIYSNPDSAYTAEDIDHAIARIQDGKTKSVVSYKDTQQIRFIQLRFLALSDGEKAKVTRKQELTTLVEESTALTTSIVTSLNTSISALTEKISASDITTLENLRNLYGSLYEEDKNQVVGFEKIENALQTAYHIQNGVEQLIIDIDALSINDITLRDKTEVTRLKSAYDALSTEDKNIVTNASKLEKAVDRIKFLEDSTLVKGMIKDISALPNEVTLQQENNVNALYKTYSNLHKDAQKDVTNAKKLTQLHTQITTQRQDVDAINETIWNRINPLNITLKEEAIVMRLMKQYEALPQMNKSYITYYSDVLMAHDIITSLQKGIIPSIVYTNIKGSDHMYTYEGMMGDYTYQVSIVGKNVHTAMDVNVQLKNTSPFDAAIYEHYNNAFIMNMEHEKELPGPSTLAMQVSSKDGTYKLFRFDTEKKQGVFMQEVQVLNGQCSFDITEGGVYYIGFTKENSNTSNIVNTSDTTNLNKILFVMIVSMITLLFMIQKRKKV